MQEKDWRGKLVNAIRTRYPDARIILFGSRVRGDYLRESDYDIIVVSSSFKGKQFTERSSEVLKLLWKAGLRGDFEVLCYTPEEFERKRKGLGIVREALKEGIVL